MGELRRAEIKIGAVDAADIKFVRSPGFFSGAFFRARSTLNVRGHRTPSVDFLFLRTRSGNGCLAVVRVGGAAGPAGSQPQKRCVQRVGYGSFAEDILLDGGYVFSVYVA